MRVSLAGLFRKNTDDVSSSRSRREREHPRFPFSDSATVCWTNEDGGAQRRVVRIIDASEGGMAVQADEPLPDGARVWILLNDGTDGRGEVRYCSATEQGYRAGLRFIAEERCGRIGPNSARNVLEWIDESERLAGSFVSIRNANAGEIEVISPEVVPCPAIVLLSGNEVRCLGCTRDWRPEGDSYCVQVEVISNTLPNSRAD